MLPDICQLPRNCRFAILSPAHTQHHHQRLQGPGQWYHAVTFKLSSCSMNTKVEKLMTTVAFQSGCQGFFPSFEGFCCALTQLTQLSGQFLDISCCKHTHAPTPSWIKRTLDYMHRIFWEALEGRPQLITSIITFKVGIVRTKSNKRLFFVAIGELLSRDLRCAPAVLNFKLYYTTPLGASVVEKTQKITYLSSMFAIS